MNCAEKRFCEPKAVSLFCQPVMFFFLQWTVCTQENMAPAGNECYNVFLFDGFYIDLYHTMYFIFGVELGD